MASLATTSHAPPAERREHPLAHRPGGSLRRAAARAAMPCSSWSEIGSAPPSRVATMARVAAEAPVSVVMHGIPRLTAAERIS